MAKRQPKSALHIEIGNQLRALREQKGITLVEAGGLTKTMGSQLSNIEYGKDNISITVLQRIVEGLGGKMTIRIVKKVNRKGKKKS